MKELLTTQYNLIKSAREVLISYCRTMQPTDPFKQVPEFDDKSIAYLLNHSANTYLHWLHYFDLEIAGTYFGEGEDTGVFKDITFRYEQIDILVANFLERHTDDLLQTFTKKWPGKDKYVTTNPLQLFTHVITHEFHHKGQILTMSRLLGYLPVDTDVIRT